MIELTKKIFYGNITSSVTNIFYHILDFKGVTSTYSKKVTAICYKDSERMTWKNSNDFCLFYCPSRRRKI